MRTAPGMRPAAFLRMIENRFVTSESSFVEPQWWAACEHSEIMPVFSHRDLRVWVGVDASVKRDSTAIVACTWDESAKRVRLVWHRVFQPSPTDPLDFEATVEATLLELRTRFNVQEVRFDPYQLIAVAQRLQKAGLPMVEFPQTVPNLTEASSNLYELIKGANLAVYADDALRLAVHRAIALETPRGWRIAKEKASHKIDVVVALAQAGLGAVKSACGNPSLNFYYYLERQAAKLAAEPAAAPAANPWAGRVLTPKPLTREERLAAYERLERRFAGRGW
jgi:phage terminase large subunit-like protein